MRLCERSEAISQACGVHYQEIAASLALLLKNLNLQIFTESSCRRRPTSRERSQQRWDLDPGLRRHDGVPPRFVTPQRGKLLAKTYKLEVPAI
jgi:hypothetical protein